ncbi:BTB/POZ domain-containing protein POB1-like [Impatiens glandulifera]|uniref:BTB/POZ domain-containing protein POB1-like n=1 Tax=Impatiens glandulifera TaxID=253017 RepID=UPI001FB0760D|nr:BTB/POZ domain-containing protein POB1-like [Impatiens glandulifera]
MDVGFSPGNHWSLSVADSDFGFAFNDRNFSDRVLRIEIATDVPDIKSDDGNCIFVVDWARNRKRRRLEDTTKKENAEEHPLNCNLPEQDTDVVIAYDNEEEEPVEILEESTSVRNIDPPGDEAAKSIEPNPNTSAVLQVKDVHISSPILAAKSVYFYELFSNATLRESKHRQVTLRILASEEAALMELLSFMYNNTLSTSSPSSLLDVLMAADKYEVASCIRHCSKLLRNLPMTCESALLYLDLPSSILMAEAVQPLVDTAKQHLAGRYKDIMKYQEDVLKLPLAGIEAVLSSDDLQVASEDTVYDFVLKWARIHYPKSDERSDILGTRLSHVIRFSYMSCRKLRKVLSCPDFNPDVSSKLVLEALFFKSEPPYRQRALAIASKFSNTPSCFVERAYKYRPVKVIEFDKPRQQCIVYLDFKREDCAHLFPSGRVYSQAFHLAGQGFFLSAHCNIDQQTTLHSFGLFLGMQEKGSASISVDYEFAVMSKPSKEFSRKYKGNYTFTGGKAVGYRNLFSMPWTAFLAEDSVYFVDGILHLKAELAIRK